MTIRELADLSIMPFDMISFICCDGLPVTIICDGDEYITEHYICGKCYFVLHHNDENITLNNIMRIYRKEDGTYKECFPNNTLENKNNVNI